MTNSEIIEEILHKAAAHGMLDEVRNFAVHLLKSNDFNQDTQSLAYAHAYRELVELPSVTETYDIYE